MKKSTVIEPIESLDCGVEQTVIREEFQTVEELQNLLDKAIHISGRHASEIHVECSPLGDFETETAEYTLFKLIAEGLSDNSVVYNIVIL